MIKEATERENAALYNFWKGSFTIKNEEALNCFFKHGIQEGKTVFCEKDEKIVAAVFMHDMNIMYQNKCLKSVYLSHVMTHPDYRKTSAMDECMKSVLSECERKALFTFTEATSVKFWETYGFQEATIHRYYELSERHFENVTVKGVYNNPTANELKGIYDQFVMHFDGYKCRTVQDFERMIEEAKMTHEYILIARNGNKPMGYIRYVIEGKHVKVKELMYLGSNSFLRLCKVALAQHDYILVELSEAEHIEKIFPLSIPRKRVAVMVRCNNIPLFNKLFNSKVKTSKDAYALTKKPRFMNEKY